MWSRVIALWLLWSATGILQGLVDGIIFYCDLLVLINNKKNKTSDPLHRWTSIDAVGSVQRILREPVSYSPLLGILCAPPNDCSARTWLVHFGWSNRPSGYPWSKAIALWLLWSGTGVCPACCRQPNFWFQNLPLKKTKHHLSIILFIFNLLFVVFVSRQTWQPMDCLQSSVGRAVGC